MGLKCKKGSECGHVAYQVKGTNIEADTLTLHTPILPPGKVERSDMEVVQLSLFFIELNTEND